MADHCQSLPASLWEETYKLHPWYILIKDDVPRVDYRSVFPKCAEKGELYYYDASSQTSTKSYREKESKSKKVIMTAVCSTRLQVQWSPHIFAPLNDKEKELLEAIPSTKQRFVTYNDQKDYLLFGAQLQINDPVQLCAGALRVPTANDVHGKLKYIGPLKGQKGTMFGIHLSTNYGDCNGTHRSTNYFKCDSLYGIFLPINKLVPLRKSDKLTQQETTKKVKHCRAAALGTEDVPQPTMLKIGVTVEIKTILQDSPQKKTLVKGTIVNMAVFEGNTLFAVELDGFKKPAVNTNGFYKGKAFFALKNPKYTVTVEQSAIRQIHSSLTSGKEEVDAERDYNGKEQFDDERRTMSYNFERGTNQFDDLQSFSSIDIIVPPKTGKWDETAGETPSKVKGKSARKSEDQEDENNIMLPASSNMVKILPSSMNMNEHHFVTNSRLKGGTSWPSDNHQHDGKPPDGSKGFISNFRSMWKSPDPPPYPFSVYEGQAIVTDSKLFHGLISELELTDKWRASTKRDQKDFFRFESVLQSWWKDIHEGHHTHLQSLLMFLGQYGREDIRDHIEKVPDRGCFDETVLNTVILSVTNSWKLFVAELGVKQHELTGKLTQDMNPYDCLRTAFDIWNTNERGCNKLGQLLKACRAIGRDTLADEIEQGLNESVLRRIGHQIKKEQWKLLGEKLLISEVRQDAFREKFKLLPERIYRMFSYWSMLQSFDANKIEMLASVLYKVDLGHVAEKELYKGLRQHELENIASLLSDNWQKLAPVFVKFQDIDYMMEQKGDSSQNCLRMLKIWRGRKIQADDGNLKETFIEAMCQCDLNREARQLYDGPPPYPFSDFHIEVITDDKKLCQGLIRGLQLENKWKAEKGREAFFRLECVLQHWWTQIYEESKTQMQEFKILLVQYGREDLRDHIDKVPDRGMFDDTILNTAIFLARKDWRKFASELGMKQNDIDEKLKQAVLPEESLRIVFHIWYKQEQGCSKLSKLVKACRSIGQHTLAEEIEQGLSYDMLRKIAHQIELKSWQRLADHLLISPVRQDAFREKFKSLPSRVYHMLSYWSMIQPFGTDKVDGLASALYDVKLGYVAQTLLYRDFGDKDCEPVEGYIDPPKNVEAYQVGMFKGIQGVHNSSYMDATLFSMFAYNSIFDAILFHDESTKEDITQVKDVLRTTIVNPLRSIGYVRGDHMLYFCNLLRGLDILQGLQAEEKDPAEFIQALLQELINVKPFLQISQGQNTTMESFMYQIFLDKQDNSDTSTVSDLLHLSFLQSDLKLAKVPECLIIQLHKYGKKNKLYDWIIPSLEMDINALIRDSPRECSDCGKLALIECKDCTPVEANEDRDVIQSFCKDCYVTRHKRKRHRITNLSVPLEVTNMFHELAEKVEEDEIAEKTQHLYPEHRMELFSVVCIETSHYVAFVKTGSGDGEQWVFFDSMADRRGDQHGYNVPEVVHLKNFRPQMESHSLRKDMKRHDFSKYLKRLLSDAYICFYRPVKNRASSHMDTNSQTTHVRSAQGNHRGYSESNQSILQPHHSLGYKDSPYQQTFNQEPTSQQVPQESNSNQRIEPEERSGMSQGFGDRDLSHGQKYDNLLYDQVANINADKVTRQKTRYADEITDENRMDWEPSENRGNCDSSQQSGGERYYSTPQHSQNSGHLKDHDIDQQSRNYKRNQNIGRLDKCNSDRHSSHLSQDTRVTGVNQSRSRSNDIRSQGVSTKYEYENLKDQWSNSDMETSQQQTLTYPTYPPNLPTRNKHRKEQQDERWTQPTTPGDSFTSNQDTAGSSTNCRKTAPSHSQRGGLEAHMNQNISPQCDSVSPHASPNRDQAGSSKGKSLITPDQIASKTSQGNQSKGEMKKNSEDDSSGNSHYSELRIDFSVSDDMDLSDYDIVHPNETSLAQSSDV